jgi:hypothetical protein
MFRLFTERYVKIANWQCVNAVIRKSPSLEDDRLETCVRSVSSGVDATDRHEELRGPSLGIVPALE